MPCNCSSPSAASLAAAAAAANSVNSSALLSNGTLPTIDSICRQSMNECQSSCFEDTRDCPGGCSGEPIAMLEPTAGSDVALERCCDANGCCGLYQTCCRNPFWPSFAHPSWLCCTQLYRQ